MEGVTMAASENGGLRRESGSAPRVPSFVPPFLPFSLLPPLLLLSLPPSLPLSSSSPPSCPLHLSRFGAVPCPSCIGKGGPPGDSRGAQDVSGHSPLLLGWLWGGWDPGGHREEGTEQPASSSPVQAGPVPAGAPVSSGSGASGGLNELTISWGCGHFLIGPRRGCLGQRETEQCGRW